MLQLLWIIKGMFLKALKVKLPNNPTVPVLSDTQKRWKAGSQGDSLITLCIAVHNILSHNNSNVYPQDKGLNKMYYVHKVLSLDLQNEGNSQTHYSTDEP